MKVCGLTGGVGMGKSTAAGLLSRHGVKVVDTDDLARELAQPGQPALQEIQSAFGATMLDASGQLRRDELARIVFADPIARKKLEDILHPRILDRWQAQVRQWEKEGVALAVVVIPLLYETQAETHFHKILCAACSPAEQRRRLSLRGWSPEQIRQRIAAQMPVEQKIARADFVIWTDGRPETQAPQLERILRSL